jgi:ubiquinone/menaquinone biosynthesis C-methylase UbiE
MPDDEGRAREMEGWHERKPDEYALQLDLVRALSTPVGLRLEVGMGTARFAGPLGVEVGVDPSADLCRKSLERGVAAVQAVGERLPFGDGVFDSALLVNVLFLVGDRRAVLEELRRVLRPAAALVVGETDAATRLGRFRREQYREELEALGGSFLTTEELTALLREGGFSPVAVAQTLFGPPESPGAVPGWEEGHGRGGFVVIKALA